MFEQSQDSERKQDQGSEYYPDRSLVCGQNQGSVYEHDHIAQCANKNKGLTM